MLLVSAFWGISLGLLSSLSALPRSISFISRLWVSSRSRTPAIGSRWPRSRRLPRSRAGWPSSPARVRSRPSVAVKRQTSWRRLRASCSRARTPASALGIAAHRIALALGLPSAAIELGPPTATSAGARSRCGTPAAHQVGDATRTSHAAAEVDQRLASGRADAGGDRRDRLAARRDPGGGRRDGGATTKQRRQDRPAARCLARPALAADGDRRRRSRAHLQLAVLGGPHRARRRRRRPRASGSRRLSTSCSTSPSCREAAPRRGANGFRSRRWCCRPAEGLRPSGNAATPIIVNV